MADYGATQTSTSTLGGVATDIPVSTVVPPGETAPATLMGGPKAIDGNGKYQAPVANYVYDGDDVAAGAKADAASTDSTQTTKSRMSFLKGVVKIWADVWDSTNHWLQVKVMNGNANGQATSVNSAPVVGASDWIAQVKSNHVEQTALTAGSLNAFLVNAFDMTDYAGYILQVTGTWSGVLQAFVSNDNVTYYQTQFYDPQLAINVSAPIFQITGNGLYYIPKVARYLDVQMTSYTSGTATGVGEAYTILPFPPNPYVAIANAVASAQNGVWSVGLTGGDIIVLASAARTTTQTQADQTNTAARGIRVVLDMTVVTASPSVTLEIDAKDTASGKYVSLLTGAAVTTISTNVYEIHPDLTAAANSIAKDILPHTWRIKVVANNANSGTYSVGASYLL
jgi:hypothetical protein